MLKNQIFYDVSVKSIDTESNISTECSNLVTEKPNGEIASIDLHPALIETEDEIINNIKSNIYLDSECNSIMKDDKETKMRFLNDGMFLASNYAGLDSNVDYLDCKKSKQVSTNACLEKHSDLKARLELLTKQN